jgi:hypothetical protein
MNDPALGVEDDDSRSASRRIWDRHPIYIPLPHWSLPPRPFIIYGNAEIDIRGRWSDVPSFSHNKRHHGHHASFEPEGQTNGTRIQGNTGKCSFHPT